MKKSLLIGSAFLLFLAGCSVTSVNDLKIEAEVSLPLGKIELSDSSLFAMAGDISNSIKVEDHMLNFVVNDNITLVDEGTINSLLELTKQSFDLSLQIPGFPPSPIFIPVPADVKKTLFMSFPSGERIDEIILKSGMIQVKMDDNGGDYSRLFIEIPEIINRQTLEPLKIRADELVLLNSNYIIKPVVVGSQENGITVVLSGEVNTSSIDGEFILEMSDMESVVGFFGTKHIDTPSIVYEVTSDFTGFADMLDYVYFANPSIAISVTNQYDVPVLVTIEELVINATVVDIKPKYNKFFIAPRATSSFVLSNSSTVSKDQISRLMGKDFSDFTMELSAQLNPLKSEVDALLNAPDNYQMPTANSFSASQEIEAQYSLVLPFDMVLSNVGMSQQVDVDLSSLVSGGVDVTDFAFGFTGTNSMPIEMKLNAYVKGADGAKKMLFKNPVSIPASHSVNEINAIPYIIEGKDMIIAEIKSDLVEELFSNKAVFFEFDASTKGASQDYTLASPVKVFSPSSIELKVVVGTKFNIALMSSK